MRALGLNAQHWDMVSWESGAPAVDGGSCRRPGHSAQGEGILREGLRRSGWPQIGTAVALAQ